MTEAEIRHRLCGVKYDCLFDERLSRRMREFMATRKTRMLNALSRLEQTQQHEPKFFWEEPARSNLLTFIYWYRGSNDVAKMNEQNKRTLNKYPDNIAALTMRLRLIQTSGRDLGEAKVILEKLSDLDSVGKNETSEKSEYHILKCEGEIAFACHFLGPMFYGEAIDRYEQVIHRSNANTGDEVEQQRCSWHFHLAQTYNRMLNKGGKQILLGHDKKTLESVYKVMCDNLIAILEKGKSTYKGRAMIELVDAFKKCKQLAAEEHIGDRRDVTANEDSSPIKFPYGQQVSLDEFVKEALHEAPEDPYVLERCGRHYRKCAKTEKEYLEAIAILDKCPSRHVAWHHKGLSYVSLWFLARDEGFQLQQSSGVRDGRGGRGTRGRGGGAGAYGRVGTSSFDRAREYMLKAKSCYQQAIKLGDNTCCRYMVDLSRAFISLGQLDEAEHCLAEAEKLTFLDKVNDGDASYLYERWAFLKLTTASGNRQLGMEETKIANNKAIVLYRKSIGSAMVCDSSTKHLLGKLRDLLQQQITRSQGHDVLCVEHDLLRLAADYYGDSHQPLVDAVKNSVDAADKVWELVNKLNDKVDMTEADRKSDMVEGNDDVSTMSFYLAVLNKAGQLNSSDITKRRKGLRMALSSAMKLCKGPASYSQGTGDVGTAAVLLPMRNVYRWAIGKDSMRMKGFMSKDDSWVDDDFDVCILSATSTSHIGSDDFTHKLVGVLEGGIGLRVKVICDEGSSVGCLESDLELGNRREAEYVDRSVARSKSIIVISENDSAAEGRQSCRWPPDNLVATFDWLHDTPTAKVCVVVKVDDCRVMAAATVEPEDRYNRWPRVNIDNDLLPQEVAFSLIDAMI